MKKKILLILSIIFVSINSFAQIEFTKFDINNNNKLLFSVKHTPIVESGYEALFLESLDEKINQLPEKGNKNPQLLTCYPEQIEILQNKSIYQFRNRYGTAQYSVNDKSLKWIKRSQELENSATAFLPVYHNRLSPLSVSPDGKYVFYLEKTSSARGKLVLKDLGSEQIQVLAKNVEFGYDYLPVLWSPDSAIAVYEKANNLYFINLKNGSFSKQIDEKYRTIGKGTIKNVFWASGKLLMYVDNDLVYAINSDELYTRALYSDLIGCGKIVGRLPTPFKSSEDKFWTSEDGLSFVLLQDNRTLWYLELAGTDFNFATTLFSYPFVTVPGTALHFEVFWTSASAKTKQNPLVWLEMLRDGKSESYLYKLVRNEVQHNAYFTSLPIPIFSRNPLLSNNKKKLAFATDKALQIYDINTWKQEYVFNEEYVSSYSWIDDSNLLLGGQDTVRTWNIIKNSYDILFLSQVRNFGWDGESDNVLASNSFGFFTYQNDKGTWVKASKNLFRPNSTRNTKWRIFLDKSPNPQYKNTLYGRELKSESYNIPLFDHASDKQLLVKPKVAITFDALDNADGLTPILSSLGRYGEKATFFINGEFVRRFPTGVNEIIKAGHQCGSMFYSPYSVADGSYKVDSNFIRRGLARNEDDFYALTNHELSLFWHMPFYVSNNTIIKSGDDSGYTWVEKGLAPLDYVTYEQAIINNANYMSSSELIDYIISNLQPGSIIPITVGISSGIRGDYLYDKLDVLISAILSEGYEIVTVSELFQL